MDAIENKDLAKGAIMVTEDDKAAISVQNAQNSPLLRLPRELRDIIYGYALGGYSIQARYKDNGDAPGGPTFIVIREDDNTSTSDWRLPGHLLALTRTCRQIHTEAAKVPFTHNVFDICGWVATLLFFTFPSLLRHRRSITTIRISDTDVIPFARWFGLLSVLYDLPESEQHRRRPNVPDFTRLVLTSLRGLKKVIVQHRRRSYSSIGLSAGVNKDIIDRVQEVLVGREVDITMEEVVVDTDGLLV